MFKKLLITTILGSAIVACSSTQPPAPVPAPESAPVVAAPPPPEPTPPVVASAPVVSNHNSVYYAFDKYDVKDGYTGIIKANSDYLATNATSKIQIQGNTDDIGSVEYNLALGQKRADAVKKALIADGTNKGQIETISYGKLKPKYPNDTDANRAQNRRADIVYKAGTPTGYSTDSSSLPVVDGSFYTGTVVEGVQ